MSSLASTSAQRPARRLVLALPPEFELLLACCGVDAPETRLQRVGEALKQGAAWSDVIRLGEHHNVLPLIYRTMRDLSPAIPVAIRDEVRARYENNARRNLRFTAELFRILDCLEAHEIAAIPYKGPALAETVYRDLALREFSDLDVLVRPSCVLRAKAALRDVGYTPNIELSPAQEAAYLASGYEYTFDGPAGRNLLEIQWAIVPRFYAVDFSMEALFDRAISSELNGRRVRALAAEDLLLTLCVHGAKHAWIRLCWLRDVAGILQSCNLDWELVAQSARQLGIERIVGIGLLLARDLLHAPLPDRITERWQPDREMEALCRDLAQHLPAAEEYNVESLQYFQWMARVRERFTDKLRFAMRLALTPAISEWKMVNLPARLFPLYRVVRLGRIAAKMIRAS